jgi:hypothetical protein
MKRNSVVICLCLSLFFIIVSFKTGFAQDRVVVIPMGSSSKMTASAAGGNQEISLTTANAQSVRSVTITVEKDGIVIVNASCYVELTGALGSNPVFRAFINDSESLNHSAQMTYGDSVNSNYTYSTVSGTRAFVVTPGTYTYYLYVDMWAGTAILRDSQINALFIPGENPVVSSGALAKEKACHEGPDC